MNSAPKLYPYQQEGVEYMLARPGAMLCDEMGTGKSAQAIGVMNALPQLRHVLIVCPASVRIPWRRELEQWLIRPLSIGVVGVDDVPDPLFARVNVLVINYDRLMEHRDLLFSRVWDLAVLDECHLLKTPEAKRSQVALKIQARKRLALSGTPIPNRPIEIYSILSWLDPLTWPIKERFRFALRYCDAKQTPFGWDLGGASHLDELSDRLRSTLMLRRLKKDVIASLPRKRRTVIELYPDTDLGQLLQTEWEAFRQFEASGLLPDQYGAKVRDLKPPRLKARDNLAIVRHQSALAKVPLVVEFVTEALRTGSEKVVVFAHHRDVIAALDERLGRFHPVQVIGGMSALNKQRGIDKFQTDPETRVFIGNIHAAGIGITLTAASHCVFAELSWVPAELSQAEDRLHRIGQEDNVLVQHLVLAGSVDAIMARRLLSKQEITDAVLDPHQKLADKSLAQPQMESVHANRLVETDEPCLEIHR
jgi:SWI/SNF-related matrix-associated actin-dependent regulator of chromatin subfamily A-like protein 1